MKIHPLANLFPMMDQASYEQLKADIDKAGGINEPIAFYQGMILDGRHRYRACQELKIQTSNMEVELPDGTNGGDAIDPLEYVISANLHRRHLTTAQRAIIGARLAKLKHGDVKTQRKNDGSIEPSIEQAAQILNTTRASIKRAKEVIRDAHPSVVQLVEQGDLSVNAASKFAKATPDKKEQAAIAKQGAGAVKKSAGGGQAAKPAGRQSASRMDDTKPSRAKDGDAKQCELLEAWKRSAEPMSDLRKVWDEMEAWQIAIVLDWIRGD